MLTFAEPKLAEVRRATPPENVVVLSREDDRLPFERVLCRDLIKLGRAWLTMPRRPGESLPRWRQFRPADFVAELPKICVLRVGDWRADEIEFSLYGGHATDYIGGGRRLVMQDLRTDPHEARRANYYDIRDRAGRAVDNGAPQYVHKTLSWNDRGYIEYETLMLPFQREDGTQRVMQPLSARTRSKTAGVGEGSKSQGRRTRSRDRFFKVS